MLATENWRNITRISKRAIALALVATIAIPAAAPASTETTSTPTSTREAATDAFKAQQAEIAARKRAAAARAAAARRRALARRRGKISRSTVLKRGFSWVKRRVPYSQSRSYRGYRTDCSGFVSMAWKARTSYTTRSFGPVTKRIAKRNLRAGDAVLYPGHVVLFVKWKNRGAGTFVAYEQANSRKDCIRSIRSVNKRGARALRYRKIL
ncbi:MAG: hypothetical protein HY876_07425 [Coriobacteriales bacterium]|nr:hypothetical protein [Coriobacteriales bacterium]